MPVIVSPDAYIRALRFGDLVHGTALGEYASQTEMMVERGINKKADLVHKDD